MSLFAMIAVLISLTALISFLNERTLRLPTPIGVTIGGLVASLVFTLLHRLDILGLDWLSPLLAPEAFNELLMHGLLGAMLFAGALELDLGDLLQRRLIILLLATVGVLISTALVGLLSWWALGALGMPISLGHALLFGALISPTDPIAVLALLKRVGAPHQLRVMICGESLFNDGVGVVVFLMISAFVTGGQPLTISGVGGLFLTEAIGGAVYGFALGGVAFLMLRAVDNYTVEILITLSVVTGGYALADYLHTSGPIAMVVAGLFIGNHGRLLGMSKKTRDHLDPFWIVVDEVLNALLFLLIGLEVLVLWGSEAEMANLGQYMLAGLVVIPLVLFSRLAAVSAPIILLRRFRDFPRGTIPILTWSGLRGGIAIALALSLPLSEWRSQILVITYAVVVFSLLAQGLTVERLVRRFVK